MDFLRKRLPAQVGRYLEGVAVPRPQGRAARKARAQRCARSGRRPAAQEAAGGRVPRPPGRLEGPATGALAASARPLELSTGELLRTPSRRSSQNSSSTHSGE